MTSRTLYSVCAFCCLIALGTAGELQFDELKFTQEWGHSACRQFKDKSGSREVTCRFEDKPSIWSIHGIWPTKKGSSGPNFCSKVTFDIGLLSPIMEDLQHYWYEIDLSKEANHFWEHEWLKHGSCAKELDAFGNELKYFSEGLDLRSKLDVYGILKSGGNIIPQPPSSSGYSLSQMQDAFKKVLGSDSDVPYFQCLMIKGSDSIHRYYLLAVEVCLDTNLKVISCSNKEALESKELIQERLGDNAGPCSPHDPIYYEDNLSFNRQGIKSEDQRSNEL